MIFIILGFLINLLFSSFSPSLMQLAQIEAKQKVTTLIANKLNNSQLSLKVDGGSYNINSLNNELGIILSDLNTVFSDENTEYSTYHIPIGSLTNNPLLIDVGPSIPLRMRLVGDVMGKIKSEVKEYGINSALVSIYIEIVVDVVLIAPFQMQNIEIVQEYPLAIDIIEGNVSSVLPIYSS